MIYNLSKYITNILISNEIVCPEDESIYNYGLQIVICKFIFYSSTLLLCFYLNNYYLETAFFLITFFSIRRYSGGYHAKNLASCLVLFLLTYFIAIVFAYYSITIPTIIPILFSIFGMISISIKAPVDCNNKRLPKVDKSKYKKYSIFYTIAFLIIAIFFSITNLYSIFITITFTIFIISLSLWIT